MRLSPTLHLASMFALILAVMTSTARGQSDLDRISHLVIPQRQAFPMGQFGEAVLIDSVRADIRIRDRTARTALDIVLRNPGSRRVEAILLLPVPDGAVISGFMFDGVSSNPTAQILDRTKARRIYDQIVARIKDPALLEFAGSSLLKSSVFPIEPGGQQTIHLVYEHLLEGDGPRIDYVLPRSEALDAPVRWQITADVQASRPISAVYSPSHNAAIRRLAPAHLRLDLNSGAPLQPGPFRLSYLLKNGDLTASLYTYPDPSIGGGYFLLMAGVPAVPTVANPVRREVTIVIDRSGSMAGEKMDQAKAAALQVIEGLNNGESFNIIDYATTVERFAPQPVVKNRKTTLAVRRYLAGIRPTGGTNLSGALAAALEPPSTPGCLPIVLFLTDGLPTVGNTDEVFIRALVTKANPAQRRVFTFGIGADVNVPLLDRIADAKGAVATYALPGESVELAVESVFKRLAGPAFSGLQLVTRDSSGQITTNRVREMMPAHLPDIYADEQLIVLGQYRGNEPLSFEVSGSLGGVMRTFGFRFELDAATTRNAFVPRLWASRRIAYLVDQIRQAGAPAPGTAPVVGVNALNDPRFRELTNEILRLSTAFGILTEYTAFLATEGTDLNQWSELSFRCETVLDQRAVRTRSGQAAVNQGVNFNRQKVAAQVDYYNRYLNADLQEVQTAMVQQINDRCFFRRGGQWIDGRLIAGKKGTTPQRTIDYGTDDHRQLIARFIREGRPGVLSLRGHIVIEIDGQIVLVRN